MITGPIGLPCCVTTLTCLSQVPLHEHAIVVFDLDDTLYEEREFVRSGFAAVSCFLESLGWEPVSEQLNEWFACGETDPLGEILRHQPSAVDKGTLLKIYREHKPQLSLASSVKNLLAHWARNGRQIGILTDGRSLTQRNKIRALGLDDYTNAIVISEEFGSGKPDVNNYRYFEERFPNSTYVYVGDNIEKDFLAPNRLGWTTVGVLDRGNNIHAQHFEKVADEQLPRFVINAVA